MPARHEIIAVIGHDAFSKLSEAFGGMTIYVPNGARERLEARNQEIMQAINQGQTTAAIRQKYQLTRRQVENIKRRYRNGQADA
jgi:Mor family transcriptional regulator